MLKVYITFVIIIILAGGIVFSKVCIYDWWWKAQEVLMKNIIVNIWLTLIGRNKAMFLFL